MRQAIVDHLRANQGVTDLVGQRVYVGRGPFGGISKTTTPEAFNADGDLLTSLVVRLETRDAIPGRPMGADALPATQIIALWVYDQHSYDAIFDVVRACKRALHRVQLAPVHDHVAWTETVWSGDGAEQLDGAFEPPVPVVATRYTATVRELLTA